MELIDLVQKPHLREIETDFRPGDTIRVFVRIEESSGKTRLQAFQGDVIRRTGRGLQEMITVRKTSYGVGVERIFPLMSPSIDRIEIVRRGRVRRARLYFLRKRTGKAARIKEARRDQAKRGTRSRRSSRAQ